MIRNEITEMEIAAEIANRLLEIKAVQLNPQVSFTWASGLQSPIYCDNRIILSYPTVRTFVKEALALKARKFEDFDTIAGVATAGIAHGMLLADALDLPFVYVRSKAKAHGRQNRIEGFIRGSERVLVVEDLISTGGSSIKVVEALREAGCTVVGVLAIFTYGFAEAQAAFAEAGCPVKTLSNYEVLIKEALRTAYISPAEFANLSEWRGKAGLS